MILRIYWFICAIIALAALAVFAIGSFSMMAGVIFGFIGFGVLFMGMIAVMPIWISHPVERHDPTIEKSAGTVPAVKPARAEARTAVSAGVQILGVGMRN